MGIITPIMTSLKDLQISYKTPYESLQDTPTSLPTSEPATGQIVYTVSENDLPVLSMGVESKAICLCIYAGGKNTDSASRTVYWKLLKNGSEVVSGSGSVPSNYFWTLNAFLFNVAIGDEIEIRLWANSSLVNWDYDARQLQLSRVALFEKKPVLLLYKVEGVEAQPSLSLGNPRVYTTGRLYVYHLGGAYLSISSPTDFSGWKQHSDYKLFRLYHADYYYSSSGVIHTSSSYRPYYRRNYVPTRLLLRALGTIT